MTVISNLDFNSDMSFSIDFYWLHRKISSTYIPHNVFTEPSFDDFNKQGSDGHDV